MTDAPKRCEALTQTLAQCPNRGAYPAHYDPARMVCGHHHWSRRFASIPPESTVPNA